VSYNGSGTFVVNSSGQPVVTGTVISSTAFNALTADLATGLSTAITKDGQTTTTARILFAQGVSSTLVTDATSATTGSIITAGGISMQKALWVGTTSRHVGATQFDAAITYGGVTLSNAVTGTGNMVLSASPTLTGTLTAAAANFSGLVTPAAAIKLTANTFVTPSSGEGTINAAGNTGLYMAGFGSTYDLILANRAGSGVGYIFANTTNFGFAGNVGIGMTPTVPLSVLGPVYATSAIAAFRGPNSGPCGIDFTVAAGMVASIKFDNTTTLTGNANSIQIVTGGGSISFAPNGTEAARIDTSGNLLVGTTSSLASTRFSVVGATNGIAVQCGNSGVGSYMTNTSGTGNWQPFSFCNTGTGFSQIGSITCTAAATAYNTSSDARLKTNVSDAAPASALIDAIQVRQFDWKVDNSHQRYGMVAQELLEVAPEAVSVPTDPEQMMGVDYSKLVPMLIKEVQSLRTRLAALENK